MGTRRQDEKEAGQGVNVDKDVVEYNTKTTISLRTARNLENIFFVLKKALGTQSTLNGPRRTQKTIQHNETEGTPRLRSRMPVTFTFEKAGRLRSMRGTNLNQPGTGSFERGPEYHHHKN